MSSRSIATIGSVALAAACSGAAAQAWREGVRLTREGSRLMYDGKPFAAVGVNKHELLDQYTCELLGKSGEEAAEARAAAERSLQKLAELGVGVARVRVSAFWPAQIEKTYLNDDPEVRETFWRALDDMLDDCDRAGIRIIPTIAWHLGGWADLGHESLADLYSDPHSKSRELLNTWIRDLVGRYRERDTILFWELTNETNLGADLRPMFPEGVLKPKIEGPVEHLIRLPVVRDVRNNYSSDELAALVRELCRLIRSIDPERLIGTGFSAPRPAAWHLWLGSLRRAEKMDWTEDTPEQQADYLRLITPDGVDLVSLHSYGGEFEALLNLKRAADSIERPVYIGELGASTRWFGEPTYDSPEAAEALRLQLEAMRAMGIPLVTLWTWDEWGTPRHEPVLRPETQPEVVRVLREGHAAAQQPAAGEPLDEEALVERLRDLSAQFEALKPAEE